MVSNVHINVDPNAWYDLVAQLYRWPDQRNSVILRYAMDELHADPSYGEGIVPFPVGDLHLQVTARTPEVAAMWAVLAERHGSVAIAARIALASMWSNFLENPDEDDDIVSSVNGAVQALGFSLDSD